jgi:hypothetical protein
LSDFTKEELINLLYSVASALEMETICSSIEFEDLRVKLQDLITNFEIDKPIMFTSSKTLGKEDD